MAQLVSIIPSTTKAHLLSPRLPGAQRGSPQRLLVPRTVARGPAPGLWARALLLVWERLPVTASPSEATHVFHFPVGLAGPEPEGRPPQGPGGGQAGPVWLVLSVMEAEGSPWPVQAHRGAEELITYRFCILKGFPHQKSQRCREEAQGCMAAVFLVSSHY